MLQEKPFVVGVTNGRRVLDKGNPLEEKLLSSKYSLNLFVWKIKYNN